MLVRLFVIYIKIGKKNVLVINQKPPSTCLTIFKNQKDLNTKHCSITKAYEIIKERYIDLLCLELHSINTKSINLLKSVKNKRLKTKSITVLPDELKLKKTMLSYGVDDYICTPFKKEDFLLRCKKLINKLPRNYKSVYETKFLQYNRKYNIVTYDETYLPLTPKEILLMKLLIREKFLDKSNIIKYLKAKTKKDYKEEYISVLIHRIRHKIKLCTGRDLIRNKYGQGYYIL
jgi:DNA-binding response OmpR family regulator